MMRVLLVVCCFAGIVLSAAFAPAVGIQTPVPDVGVEGDGEDDIGDDIGADVESDDGNGIDGNGNGIDGESGVDSYGGVSAGGYPEETTVGGELSLSDHEELLIESPQASRWRLGAYAQYTGDGWDRESSDREPLSAPLPTATGDRPQPAYDIQVTPKRSVRALATAPRPAFAAADDRQVYADAENGLTVDEPIQPGERYFTVTYGPPSREAPAESDGAYPPEIESRYTQVPDSTPDRLGERTGEITEDAETPYEAATAVQTWLETNKEYSLEATHDRDGDVADEFVFEMDAGYCQYFATSMVAMLRTQGIPARYVTGYSPGEQVDDDEYLVRGKNAHAWVEVYITDVGWVTFDPTPAGGREDAGRDSQSLDEEDFSDPEPEDPEETPGPDEEDAETEDDRTDEEETDEEVKPVEVSLTPDPVPGREVTATVTRDEEPIADATVFFNEKRVGQTDSTGNVTGEVPYSQSLEIEVRLDDGEPRLAGVGGTSGGFGSAPEPRLLASENTSVSFEVPTEIDIDVFGDPAPQQSVDIAATIADEPVRDGTVSVDGQQVAQTDDEGRATVTLPDADTVELVVERDEASGNRSLNLTQGTPTPSPTLASEPGALNLSMTPSLPLAVPYTSVTAVAEHEGSPVPNATVTVEGETVGETDQNGTLTFELPLTDTASVTAAAVLDAGGEPATAETTVDGLYRNLALLGGVALVVVAGVLGAVYRRGFTPGALGRLARRVVTGIVVVVVGSIVTGARLLDTSLVRLLQLVKHAIGLLGDGIEGVIALCVGVYGWLRSAGRRSVAVLRTLPRRLHPLAILAFLRSLRRSAAESVAGIRADTSGGESADTAAGEDRPPTIQELWTEFRSYVTIRSWRTSTPGEIASWAVDRDGLPPEPVATLRDAFRDVEYGARSSDEYAPAAQDALKEIRESQRIDEGGEEA